MPPLASERFVLRLSGEITTKGRGTRLQFLKRLHHNVEDALTRTGVRHRVRREWSRILVEAPSAAALTVLPRVFGVQSLSRVEARPWRTLDDVVAAGLELHRDTVAARRFAVRARRGGDRRHIPFRSGDVERRLGAALLPASAGVDLADPEVTVHADVREEEVLFFTGSVAGRGGLPVGSAGRALALVSGGFDSAVAAWSLLKRGVRLDYLFLNLAGAEHRKGVLQVMKLVAERWSYGYRPKLHAVDLQPAVAQLRERTDPRYWQVVLKRLMVQAGDALAPRLGAEALVTGESVSQVSSQTLRNLGVIDRATELPILRPLVAANKDEILALARSIDTYDLSATVPEFCALDARRPATHAVLQAVLAEEAKLDPGLLVAAVEGREVVDLVGLSAASLTDPALAVERIPAGARVVDLRSRRVYEAWHWPGAEHREYFDAVRDPAALAGSEDLVFYCEVGLKSAHLAELVRGAGGAARHVEGGFAAVLREAEREDPALAAALSPAWRG